MPAGKMVMKKYLRQSQLSQTWQATQILILHVPKFIISAVAPLFFFFTVLNQKIPEVGAAWLLSVIGILEYGYAALDTDVSW